MKAGELIDSLMTFGNDDELEIDIHETATGKYGDTTAAITIVEDAIAPALKIDVEADKLKTFMT